MTKTTKKEEKNPFDLSDFKKQTEELGKIAGQATDQANNVWGTIMHNPSGSARQYYLDKLAEQCFNQCVDLEESIRTLIKEILYYEHLDKPKEAVMA